MKISRTAIVLAVCVVVFAGPLSVAIADREDLVTVRRMGPVRRSITEYEQVKRWFGRPDRVDRHGYQCIRVIDAVWRDKFKMFFDTFDKTMVVAIAKRHRVMSDRHGELTFHTRKGLHIGDSYAKLHRLYPDADRHNHPRRDLVHHILISNGRGRLEATTSHGRVTELRTFPYEAC
jgi:hypothetical protein